jgi:exonuclease III
MEQGEQDNHQNLECKDIATHRQNARVSRIDKWNTTKAIQEIRWSGTGLIKKQNYSLYYSEPSSKTGQAGTEFILLKKRQNYVIGFEPYNVWLCKLRIKGKYNNIMLINVYVPTEDHTEETREQFYDNLQYLLDKTSKMIQ